MTSILFITTIDFSTTAACMLYSVFVSRARFTHRNGLYFTRYLYTFMLHVYIRAAAAGAIFEQKLEGT